MLTKFVEVLKSITEFWHVYRIGVEYGKLLKKNNKQPNYNFMLFDDAENLIDIKGLSAKQAGAILFYMEVYVRKTGA